MLRYLTPTSVEGVEWNHPSYPVCTVWFKSAGLVLGDIGKTANLHIDSFYSRHVANAQSYIHASIVINSTGIDSASLDDPLTYSASNLPEGADFNAETRTFS